MSCGRFFMMLVPESLMGPPLLFSAQGLRYRKLEVILTTSIDKLGKSGETVKVAPGYFCNYLMPKLLAVPNIDKFAYLVKEQRKLARQLGVRIAPENIYIPSPLSTFGEDEIPLRFPKSIPLPEGKVMWTLDVKVRRK